MVVTKAKARQPLSVSVRDLNDQIFFQALEKLDGSAALKGKKALLFADFKEACDKLHQLASQEYNRLVFKYVEMEPIMAPNEAGEMQVVKDENGVELRRPKVLRDENGKPRDFVYLDQAAFQAEREALLSKSMTTELYPITMSEAAEAKLSPKELRAIRNFLQTPPPEPRLVAPEVCSS